jgi:hypothetical protein
MLEVKMLKANSPQPMNSDGVKAIDCPFYSDCLMHAAKHKWSVWTCAKCPNLKLDSVCRKLKFISPYYQLLAEIYPEFKTRYEPAISLLDLEH